MPDESVLLTEDEKEFIDDLIKRGPGMDELHYEHVEKMLVKAVLRGQVTQLNRDCQLVSDMAWRTAEPKLIQVHTQLILTTHSKALGVWAEQNAPIDER